MPAIRDIRRHIRSVSSVKKIAKTMEMVAAAKTQTTTAVLAASRPYAQLAWSLLADVSTGTERELHPLLRIRPVQKSMIVLITSDRGLCGAYNVNVINQALQLAPDKKKVTFVTVGRKGRNFLIRHGFQVIAEFTGLAGPLPFLHARPIAQIVMSEYGEKKVDEVIVVYCHYLSNVQQKPSFIRLLPLKKSDRETPFELPITYEPAPEQVLTTLIPRIIEYEIYATILESQASEFAARRIAMKNATENAEKLIDELTLLYHRARQENITKELNELSTSRAALEGF